MRVAFRDGLPISALGRSLDCVGADSNAMIVPDVSIDASNRQEKNSRQRAYMNLRAVLDLGLVCALGAAVAWGQPSPVNPEAAQSASFGLAPEDAYLSQTRYDNAYFGFSFDFPEGLTLRPVPQPAAMDRRIQLLELAGATSQRAAVSISAYEYKNKNYTDAKTLLRRELDKEVFYGVEQVHGLSKTSVGDRSFYYFETRKAAEQRAFLAAEIGSYVLQVELRSTNVELLRKLFAAFSKAEFFPPAEAARRAGPQASLYQGPSISEQQLQSVRESKPAEHIAPGTIKGTTYSNQQIGVTYDFPQDWNVEPEGAIEPAVERYREKVSGEPTLGPRERAVVNACRKTLLSAWRTKPSTEGEVSYDDFGEVTLSALPLSCFPNIRFPKDLKDAAAVREFIVGLSFTQPLQRDMTSAGTFEAGGRPFVLTHGTIAYKEQGESLSRRISVAMAMTQQRGYLLTWLFAAPHEAELRELIAAKIALEEDGQAVGKDTDVRRGSDLPVSAPDQHTAATEPSTAGQTAYRPSLRSGAEDGPAPSGQNNLQTGSQPPH